MAFNRVMFVDYGDEGHYVWKCLKCKGTFNAGHPSAREFTYCPHCGTKWEGEQENTKLDAPKYYQFDTTADMKMKRERLHWRLDYNRKVARQREIDLQEYRKEVERHIDEFEEYANFFWECRPRLRVNGY